MTSPSSVDWRAISISMCASNARWSAGVAAPCRARWNSASIASGVCDSVHGSTTAWSVAVAPADLKNARRSASAATNASNVAIDVPHAASSAASSVGHDGSAMRNTASGRKLGTTRPVQPDSRIAR